MSRALKMKSNFRFERRIMWPQRKKTFSLEICCRGSMGRHAYAHAYAAHPAREAVMRAGLPRGAARE